MGKCVNFTFMMCYFCVEYKIIKKYFTFTFFFSFLRSSLSAQKRRNNMKHQLNSIQEAFRCVNISWKMNTQVTHPLRSLLKFSACFPPLFDNNLRCLQVIIDPSHMGGLCWRGLLLTACYFLWQRRTWDIWDRNQLRFSSAKVCKESADFSLAGHTS